MRTRGSSVRFETLAGSRRAPLCGLALGVAFVLLSCGVRDVESKGGQGGAAGQSTLVDTDQAGGQPSTTTSTADAGAAGAGGLWDGRDDAGADGG